MYIVKPGKGSCGCGIGFACTAAEATALVSASQPKAHTDSKWRHDELATHVAQQYIARCVRLC